MVIAQEWRGSKRFNWLQRLETGRIGFASAINTADELGPESAALQAPAQHCRHVTLPRAWDQLHRLHSSTDLLCTNEEKLQPGQRFPRGVKKTGTPLPAWTNQAGGARGTSSPGSGG